VLVTEAGPGSTGPPGPDRVLSKVITWTAAAPEVALPFGGLPSHHGDRAHPERQHQHAITTPASPVDPACPVLAKQRPDVGVEEHGDRE
jgi:hypothetical protein